MKFSLSSPTKQFLLLVGLISLCWFLGRTLDIDLLQVRTELAQYPHWISGLLFVLIYVGLTTVLWFGTIDLFRITGAMLFGPYWSTLFVTIAEIGNASILFFLSRKLGREFVEEKFHLKKNDKKYSPQNAGFWTAFVLRINPFVPFRFMDVGFGLTKLPFRKYFYAVVLGSPLRIFWLQFVIASIGEAVLKNPSLIIEYLQNNKPAMAVSLFYIFAVILVTVSAFVVTMIKRNALLHQLSNSR